MLIPDPIIPIAPEPTPSTSAVKGKNKATDLPLRPNTWACTRQQNTDSDVPVNGAINPETQNQENLEDDRHSVYEVEDILDFKYDEQVCVSTVIIILLIIHWFI